jgi:hypothetical protein
MFNPGDYSLCDQAIATALSSVALTPVQNLQGMVACTIAAKFSAGSGGTTAKAYVQATTDDGLTWFDIACFAFTTVSAQRVINLSGLTPVTNAITPVDGALPDNTCIDGIFGASLRVKLVTTGTYANTSLSVKISTR